MRVFRSENGGRGARARSSAVDCKTEWPGGGCLFLLRSLPQGSLMKSLRCGFATAAVGETLRIAVFVPNKPFLGARIVQIPFFVALRRRFPGAEIRLYSPVPEARDFADWGLADSWRGYDLGRATRWLRLVADVRRWRPDRVFNLRRKSFACSFAAAFAPGESRGYREGLLSRLLDEVRAYDSSIYLAARYVSLLEPDVRDGRDTASTPLFREWLAGCTDALHDPAPAAAMQPSAGAPVLLLPGAGDVSKKWPLANFLEIAGPIAEGAQAPVVLLLGPAEEAERGRLLSGALVASADRRPLLPAGALGNTVPVEIADSPSFAETCMLAAASRLTVANDCGPSHLAQLAGGRFLGLYSAERSTLPDWFLDKENSELLVAAPGRGLDSIPVAAVVAKSLELLGRPQRCERFVRYSRAVEGRPSAASS